MVVNPPSRSPWPLAVAIALALYVAIMVGYHETYFETKILEEGDMASNALQIDDAKRFSELYGNYSRFQFNHPGPGFFYLYAAGEIVLHDWLKVVPSPHNAHLLASLLVQVLCFALALAILHCWFDSWTFVALALLGGVWHFSMTQGAFTSLWPPHVLLMPFLCFLAAVSSFAAGRLRELPVMVVAGSFLFHGHVAQPLFIGSLAVFALFLHFRLLKSAGSWAGWRGWCAAHRLAITFCGAWILLMLLPLAIDVALYRGESNFATIVRRFLVNADDPKSILQSLLYFLSFTTYATNQDQLFGQITRESWYFFAEHAAALVLWLLCILVPAGLVLLRRNNPSTLRQFLKTGYLVWLVTVPLCIAWGLVQSGPMWQFNGFFYYGIYYFAGLLGLGLICSMPGRMLPVPVTGALCVIAGIGASWLFRAGKWNDEDAGQVVQRGIDAALKDHTPGRPILLVFEHADWPPAASVALALQRQGIEFYASPSWNFLFGRRHNAQLLGDDPAKQADIWWITRPGKGGYPIRDNLSLFTRPAEVDPQNTEISFAGHANGYRYLVGGLSTGNVEFALTDQRKTQFLFQALPAGQDVQLLIDAHVNKHETVAKLQPAEVYFNDTRISTVELTDRNQFSINLPKETWNARPVAKLELRFPAAASFRFFSRPADHLWFAWGLRRFWFASTPTDQARARFASDGTEPPAGVLGFEDRIDFTATGNLKNYLVSGIATAERDQTRIAGNSMNLVFRPEPSANDLLLQVVAHPYAEGAKPRLQRCEIRLNGQLIFGAPFDGPGVARALIPRDLWNRLPLAQLRITLPDATPADVTGQPQHGLAIRWLSVTPQYNKP